MPRKWSRRSKQLWDLLDPRLQILTLRLRDEVADISIVWPHGAWRSEIAQDDLYAAGVTKVRFPNSKHNRYPSHAVDIQPYPYPSYEPKLWGALGYLAGRAYAIAAEEGFRIRWGGDWNGNGDLTDQNFDDLFHIELVTDNEETDSELAGGSSDDLWLRRVRELTAGI